jgi:hypothetical protein
VTTGLLHEPVDLAQAQPGALAGFFGCEERLEGAVDRFRRHASATIRHCDKNVLAGDNTFMLSAILLIEVGVACLNGKLPTFRHGIARIQRKVEQR